MHRLRRLPGGLPRAAARDHALAGAPGANDELRPMHDLDDSSAPLPDAEPQLPEVFAGDLDGPLFEDYFTDLEELAEIRAVMLKDGPEDRAEASHVSLDQARMLLVVGSVRGVQIRYLHDGVEWVDTLVRQPQSVRLVRMEAPLGATADAPAAEVPTAAGRKRRLRVLAA